MRSASGPQTRADDNGFTLIELIVYVSLFAVILFIVGGFMISSLRIERDVSSVSVATDTAQLVAISVQAGVRNGSGVRIETASSGDQMLVARTTSRGSDASWVCQAWYYSASMKAVYTKTSAVAISWPTSSLTNQWTLLGEGIVRTEAGGPLFQPIDQLPTNGRAFGPPSSTVAMLFEVVTEEPPFDDVEADTKAPVRIETAVNTRIDVAVGAPCF